MYGSESWTILKTDRQKLEALEIWLLRRMMKINWTDKVSNEEVLGRAGGQRCLLNTLAKQQVNLFVQVIGKGKVEHLVLTGKIFGQESQKVVKTIDDSSQWIFD